MVYRMANAEYPPRTNFNANFVWSTEQEPTINMLNDKVPPKWLNLTLNAYKIYCQKLFLE